MPEKLINLQKKINIKFKDLSNLKKQLPTKVTTQKITMKNQNFQETEYQDL